jgi:hypothetical protein
LFDAYLVNIWAEEISYIKFCGGYVKDAYVSRDKDTCKTGGNSFTSFILILRTSGEEKYIRHAQNYKMQKLCVQEN